MASAPAPIVQPGHTFATLTDKPEQATFNSGNTR